MSGSESNHVRESSSREGLCELEILISADDSSTALRRLYETRKARSKHFSLTWISKQTGASKGYISDVFNGRRILNPSYWEAFAELFQLKGASAQILNLLLNLDREKDGARCQEIKAELNAIRKASSSHLRSFPQRIQGMFFALELLCAFGLFRNAPTRQELRQHYGVSRGVDLEHALAFLLGMNLICFDGERYGLVEEHINFLSDDDGLSYQSYLKEAIGKAQQELHKWYRNRDEAIFESTFVSTRASTYLQEVNKIRESIHRMQADLETGDADTLLLFNIQVFPVDRK